jgi:hypothetical protein
MSDGVTVSVTVSVAFAAAPSPAMTTDATYVPTANDAEITASCRFAGAAVPVGKVVVSHPVGDTGLYVMLNTRRLVSGKTPEFVTEMIVFAGSRPTTAEMFAAIGPKAITAGGAAATLNDAEVAAASEPLVNVNVRVPAVPCTLSGANVATPATAAMLTVPPSVPPPEAIAAVTVVVEVVRLPCAS